MFAMRFNLIANISSGSLMRRDMKAKIAQISLLDPPKYAQIEPRISFSSDTIGPFLLKQQTTAKPLLRVVPFLRHHSSNLLRQGKASLKPRWACRFAIARDRRAGAYTPNGVSLYARWPLSWVPAPGESAKDRLHTG